VKDSVENVQNAGLFNGKPAVLVILHPSPGANIIQTVDKAKAVLPQLRAALPPSIQINVAMDRSQSIRAALSDTERALFIAVLLVVGVVFVFLRSASAMLIPGLAVPISIIGSFGPMYLLGFSLDNLSLMALTIATGFVVDDAVVVVENISRHLAAGLPRAQAALRGSAEVSFTVLSMSLSLIAVFLPILLMPGIVGRLFREFSETLAITILISLIVSQTTTPMLCSLFLNHDRQGLRQSGRLKRFLETGFDKVLGGYEKSLGWALRHAGLVGMLLIATIVLNVYLFKVVPKGFFPEQDNGLLIGTIRADQEISFALMKKKLTQLQDIVRKDPAVATAAGFIGGRATNSGFMFITLKPHDKRRVSAARVVARLRKPLAAVPGVRLFMVPAQDLRVGGRQSAGAYQYTLQSDDKAELYAWIPKIVQALKKKSTLLDVNSDLQEGGLETDLVINRPVASRLGITPSQIDNTLYDAYGQRQVSTIYRSLNQYHVVMELAPQYLKTPDMLKEIYVSTSGGRASGTAQTNAPVGTVVLPHQSVSSASMVANVALDSATNQAINSIAASGRSSASSGAAVSTHKEVMVPLAALAAYKPGHTPISVSHQNGLLAGTISFNLPAGQALGKADREIQKIMSNLDVPLSIQGGFAGTAAAFKSSLASEPLLIIAALAAVYIVLGILYESLIHPITILSTIPSAGIGALLLLLLINMPLTIIALIGVILLIGIVKKNAILMIDFALQLERGERLSPKDAIFKAAILRFRPIMMTTFAAILGALPLAVGLGQGASLRQPLGITIIGGLVMSQVLTLYTTPVVYLFLDRLGTRLRGRPSAAPLRAENILEIE
jgi:multidrug efflux pump